MCGGPRHPSHFTPYVKGSQGENWRRHSSLASTPETGKGGIEGEERRTTDRRISERRGKRDGDETRGVGKNKKDEEREIRWSRGSRDGGMKIMVQQQNAGHR